MLVRQYQTLPAESHGDAAVCLSDQEKILSDPSCRTTCKELRRRWTSPRAPGFRTFSSFILLWIKSNTIKSEWTVSLDDLGILFFTTVWFLHLKVSVYFILLGSVCSCRSDVTIKILHASRHFSTVLQNPRWDTYILKNVSRYGHYWYM